MQKTMMPFLRLVMIVPLLSWLDIHSSVANTYTLGDPNPSLIGKLGSEKIGPEDTLLDIARRNGFGYREIKLANPGMDTWLPTVGKQAVLPSLFILPNVQKKGIILNIPEMRLYYYPPNETDKVITHPLGIGREGWATPYVHTKITEKKARPHWYPPQSIREEYQEMGRPLPKIVYGGTKDNPLGDYAMRLGIPQYLIHGTNEPYGVGMRVSHGCIRLYPEDIASLFYRVNLDTSVNIINQPYKIGVSHGIIYLEAHPILKEDESLFKNKPDAIMRLITHTMGNKDYDVDWAAVIEAANSPNGIPVPIGLVLANTR